MSGYVNRLQAMASATLLAEDLSADVHHCWVPFDLVPGGPRDIFAPSWVEERFISREEAATLVGRDLDEIPRYTGILPGGDVAFLRGHDKGEQALLPTLINLLTVEPPVNTLAVVAGGSFGLDPLRSTLHRKRGFYQSIRWHPDIHDRWSSIREAHPEPFAALHLRYTDRILQAPSDRDITAALERLRDVSPVRSLFIASDTPEAATRWSESAATMGFTPWTVDHPVMDRRDPRSAHGAIIDWILLGEAERLVYFGSSSFAVEAACAAGTTDSCFALWPSALHQWRGRARAAAGAAKRRAGLG